ncbi:PD-(D/E)XK nuclease family protein [Peptostreptococcus equinus]|uniref:PD-(D/E)XK nuclease family protein n=1 Tax=Peptostreptococcus equinus TaxID=3003601 RepID=A0ABY7JLV5_9FIRM|nr:PD-(D/E)XK nuclease family protein [Peptostreptococcus sp. CBA3647]WAW14334.1 PD-(D/E)XK nuclease family protein [Peptostreptococcus sp. CBA3647]
MAKINIKDNNISKEQIKYRLDNLIFSQNMLNTWKIDRKEFFNKYIRSIFWSDDSILDQRYEENMAFGRDFHLNCQRIFMDIELGYNFNRDLLKIISIRDKYRKKYGKNVVFKPEYQIILSSKVSIIADLIVEIYEEEELKNIHIWDWKTETKEITELSVNQRMQTKMYMYTVKESIGKDLNYEDINMYYMQVKIDKTQIIKYSQQMHEKNKKEIFNLIKQIKEEGVDACQ